MKTNVNRKQARYKRRKAQRRCQRASPNYGKISAQSLEYTWQKRDAVKWAKENSYFK